MINTARRKLIFEGNSKSLFEGPEPGSLILHFKDELTACNNSKKGNIIGKGVLNNRISEYLMVKLGSIGIPTHFIRSLNMREQMVRKVDIIPINVVIRNVVAGGLSQRLGLEEGVVLPRAIIEFHLINNRLGDPLISEDYITAFGWADPFELEEIKLLSIRINDFLTGLFLGAGMRLIDCKIEFGRFNILDTQQIVLADEISPDCCRLWDIKTNEKLDKDRFKLDLGGYEEAYQEVAKRLGVLSQENDETNQEDNINYSEEQ